MQLNAPLVGESIFGQILGRIREQIIGPIMEWSVLFAVPKHKRSTGERRRRFFTQIPNTMKNIEPCKICGAAKLKHNLCMQCYRKYLDYTHGKLNI